MATEQFLTPDNLLLLTRQAAIFSIVGIGTTFVVLLGELDISFGAVVSLSGCVGAAWIVGGHPPLVGFTVAIVIGIVVGAVNGVLVTRFRIASVVATLGTLGVVEGLAAIYTGGSSIFGDQLDSISDLYLGKVLGIPVIALLAPGPLRRVHRGRDPHAASAPTSTPRATARRPPSGPACAPAG